MSVKFTDTVAVPADIRGDTFERCVYLLRQLKGRSPQTSENILQGLVALVSANDGPVTEKIRIRLTHPGYRATIVSNEVGEWEVPANCEAEVYPHVLALLREKEKEIARSHSGTVFSVHVFAD